MKRFTVLSWEIILASGWTAEKEEHCVTIVNSNDSGALQISSYQKEDGEISREDLLEVTCCDEETRKHLAENQWGDFTGFQLVYSEDNTFWRQWWVANGRTLLFVTYNCELSQKDEETEEINRMVASLSSRAQGNRRRKSLK